MRITKELRNKVEEVFQQKKDELSKICQQKRKIALEKLEERMLDDLELLKDTFLYEVLVSQVTKGYCSEQFITKEEKEKHFVSYYASRYQNSESYDKERQAIRAIEKEQDTFLIELSYFKDLENVIAKFEEKGFSF